MSRKNVFVKVSGDVCTTHAFVDWLRRISDEAHVVVCVGGGTQINEEFARRGIPLGKHGPLGRQHRSFEERQIARDVLEQNQAALQDLLVSKGIAATVVIPVLDIGSVLCHVNGDEFLKAAYLGFDELYVVTVQGRDLDKKVQFAGLPKVKIASIIV